MASENQNDRLQVKKVVENAILPTRAHPDDAGLDLYALEAGVIPPGGGISARTGIAFALPPKSVGMVADRSSLAKKGFKAAGGIIDAGYRGEVQVILRNLTSEPLSFDRGERIAQLLILPIYTPAVEEVSDLDATARGTSGFGSTGRF
jgi:dUTP pyrophosphatase